MTEHKRDYLKGGSFKLYTHWFKSTQLSDYNKLIPLCQNTTFIMFLVGFYHSGLMTAFLWLYLVENVKKYQNKHLD